MFQMPTFYVEWDLSIHQEKAVRLLSSSPHLAGGWGVESAGSFQPTET